MAYMMKKTLCWDCAKATGGCRWSDNLKPVPGWDAEEVVVHNSKTEHIKSYIVNDCPEFVRDATDWGSHRLCKK